MLKLFKRLELKDWLLLLVSVALIVFQVWIELELLDYTKEITMLVKTSGGKMSDIWVAGGKMLACAFGSLISAVLVSYISAVVSSSLARKLRKEIYNKIESFSMEEMNRFSISSLITRTTNDVNQVQFTIVMSLQSLIKAPVMAIWVISEIVNSAWQWSVSVGVAVFALAIMLTFIIIFALPKFKQIQKLTDNLNSVTRENLTGVRVVRAYNAEDYQEKKFEKANVNLTKTHLFTSKLMSIMSPGMTLVSNGLQLAIYWIGAYLIANAGAMDKLTLFTDMSVYMMYAMKLVMSFMLLIFIFMLLPRATVSARRINEVLDTTPNIISGKFVPDKEGKITGVEFKNVSFKYPDAKDYVLKNVSFSSNAGEVIAFIGSTGSGKSTLINLIPRFYDATEGQILIDGVDIKDYDQKELLNKIGYVPQKAVLFRGSVKENIAFGENGKFTTMEDVEESAETAQAKPFIENLDKKYDYMIAQGGTNLSGGQKQRVAIARAIARKPEIFIFDDSFSALDYKTDKILRQELKKKTKEATTFIVAQRIGTIKDADKIIVLDEGNVVGIGTHKELLRNCEVYKEIAYSQLSKEELENE